MYMYIPVWYLEPLIPVGPVLCVRVNDGITFVQAVAVCETDLACFAGVIVTISLLEFAPHLRFNHHKCED